MILSEEHKLLQESARQLALRSVAPYAAQADAEAKFPLQQLKDIAKSGLLLVKFPEEYGGGGSDMMSYSIMMQEVSRECPATGVSMAVQNLTADCILKFGTEEQKKKYLPKMATCEILGGFALTEPGAGSDAAAQSTTAVDKGDHYLLNGTKTFITSADFCDFLVLIAKSDSNAPGTKGLSAFIVEKGQFTVGKHEDKMGMRGSHTVEVLLKDAKVPKANLLGPLGSGFKVAMTGLDGGRVGIASQATGVLQALLDESIAYSKQRVQFGRPISANQAIQWMIVDMAKDLSAARELTYHAALLYDNNLPFGMDAAIAKLFASEAAMKHAIKAVQIQGGYGYCKPAKVERLMRDIKITEIYEGTSEVQRMVISGGLLR